MRHSTADTLRLTPQPADPTFICIQLVSKPAPSDTICREQPLRCAASMNCAMMPRSAAALE